MYPSSRFDVLSTRYSELQAELTNLVQQMDGPCPGEMLVRHALDGSIKLYDAIILADLIAGQSPRRILEVGSFIGFSTRWLLESSRATEATVVSVDPGIRHRVFDQPGQVLRHFNAAFLATRLVQKCGFFSEKIPDHCYFDYEHYAPVLTRPEVDAILQSRPLFHCGNLGEESFDLIFIDGDHGEQAVVRNFTEALPLLEPRGLIVFHDALSWPEVHRALGHIATEYADLGQITIHGETYRRMGPPEACDGVGVFSLR